MTALLDTVDLSRDFRTPHRRTVMMVIGPLEEEDLDNLAKTQLPGQEKNLHWLTVAVAYTSATGDALLAELMASRHELASYMIEDLDISIGRYAGRMADGMKIFFDQRDGHWLIFPRK